MGDYYCNECDTTIKLKSMKKHINTRSHGDLSVSIINKNYVEEPKLLEMEEILKKQVDDNNTMFEMYHVKCEG